MVWPAILRLAYPPPPSVFITAITVIGGVGLANGGLSEIRGTHMKYSKFWNVHSPVREARVTSRTGMLAVYMPAFVAGAASFWIFPAGEGLRFLLLRAALTLHFLKRVLEVLFVHKFSGFMAVDSMCVVSLSYFFFTVNSIYILYLSRHFPEPSIDLTYPGLALFLIGVAGNFYHHLILSRLRSAGGNKEYKIPQGGLFSLVTCPHYLFEIIDFVGLSFISQTIYGFVITLGTIIYLIERSYATRRWYLSKFDDFPRHVKALFPFVF
ncbi:very-long-chain enoyl-CoA reductase-like [Punica granatum]|uniref:Very-long-chain enoyl-CoA reductase-like n=1 Tax=Punica granatum TaxID=22663 RepID=A0A6P8CIJ9_PUNGR|nr:very-long-chain enoyl-CoA reductase-like [Punica granatum]